MLDVARNYPILADIANQLEANPHYAHAREIAGEYEAMMKDLKDIDTIVKINMQREKITFASKIEFVCEKSICLRTSTPHYFFERSYDIDLLMKINKLSSICSEVTIEFQDNAIVYSFTRATSKNSSTERFKAVLRANM